MFAKNWDPPNPGASRGTVPPAAIPSRTPPAGQLLAHRLDHLLAARDRLQHLGHVLADANDLVAGVAAEYRPNRAKGVSPCEGARPWTQGQGSSDEHDAFMRPRAVT